MESDQVFLILGHVLNESLLDTYQKIRDATKNLGPTFLLFNSNDSLTFPAKIERKFVVNEQMLNSLDYRPCFSTIVPGSTHFPLVCFWNEFSNYQHYWIIEYDVRFSGNWERFFRYFANSREDLLTCHIRGYQAEPRWYWWSSLKHPLETISLNEYYRSFNPIYRISNPALKYIDQKHRSGWIGHYEGLFPTLLYHGGYGLRDFGGSGPFVNSCDKNRFYFDGPDESAGILRRGTMRWRPNFKKIGWIPGKLYHPIK